MEGITDKLWITFSPPPHEVGIEAANTLPDALDEFAVNASRLLRANFRGIAHDLRVLRFQATSRRMVYGPGI